MPSDGTTTDDRDAETDDVAELVAEHARGYFHREDLPRIKEWSVTVTFAPEDINPDVPVLILNVTTVDDSRYFVAGGGTKMSYYNAESFDCAEEVLIRHLTVLERLSEHSEIPKAAV